jgi:hypothetical protein
VCWRITKENKVRWSIWILNEWIIWELFNIMRCAKKRHYCCQIRLICTRYLGWYYVSIYVNFTF